MGPALHSPRGAVIVAGLAFAITVLGGFAVWLSQFHTLGGAEDKAHGQKEAKAGRKHERGSKKAPYGPENDAGTEARTPATNTPVKTAVEPAGQPAAPSEHSRREGRTEQGMVRISMRLGGKTVWEGTGQQFRDKCRRHFGDAEGSAWFRDATYILVGAVRSAHAPGGPFEPRVRLGEAVHGTVRCICRQDQAQKVNGLQRGQRVTLTGKVKTIGRNHVVSNEFVECIIKTLK